MSLLKSIIKFPKVFAQSSDQLSPEEIVGSINVPKGIDQINTQAGGIGIILFASNMIRLIIVVGGIWSIINIFFAAFIYITGGGKTESHQKVRARFTMSVVGLLLMIVSYSVAALIGLIFYGDANFIITPTLTPIGE